MNPTPFLSALTMVLVASTAWAVDPASPEKPPTAEQIAKPPGFGTVSDELGYKGFNILKSLLDTAGLDGALDGAEVFTIFAPADVAFNKLPKGQLEALLKDKEKLAALLKRHIVPGKVKLAGAQSGKVKAVDGGELDLQITESGATVNGAKVLKKDLPTSNGVIHGVDTVLR